MCHQGLILDREESPWVAGQVPPERETTKKRRLGECTSASLLGLAEAPGKVTIRNDFLAGFLCILTTQILET
jgi:hypothetical protein